MREQIISVWNQHEKTTDSMSWKGRGLTFGE